MRKNHICISLFSLSLLSWPECYLVFSCCTEVCFATMATIFFFFPGSLIKNSLLLFLLTNMYHWWNDVTGMEIYPATSPLLEFVPEPLLAGVLGGVGFMCLALVLLLGSACVISHKRDRRRRKKDGKTPLTPETQQTLTLMNCIMNIIIYSIKYWRHFQSII